MRGTLRAALLTLFLCAGPANAEPLSLDIVAGDVYRDDIIDEPYLLLRLSPAAAAAFNEFTGRRVGCPIDVRVDGRLIMTATVREPIRLGSFTLYAYDQDIHAISRPILLDRVTVEVDDAANEPPCAGELGVAPETS